MKPNKAFKSTLNKDNKKQSACDPCHNNSRLNINSFSDLLVLPSYLSIIMLLSVPVDHLESIQTVDQRNEVPILQAARIPPAEEPYFL